MSPPSINEVPGSPSVRPTTTPILSLPSSEERETTVGWWGLDTSYHCPRQGRRRDLGLIGDLAWGGGRLTVPPPPLFGLLQRA
ncbi:hypothetical protein CRG98_014336 [Punica granatum]|uniref:Uncharacterized protein n=1 Tax=Punica granatum TaxID=22663 RepID=A0A2I0K9S9_PUNGR|nr:hypothetical protein CRG98_014336 [Punica granatum]